MIACDLPPYWNLLCANDQIEYIKLKESIVPLTFRTTKQKIAKNFKKILTFLKCYIENGDADEWKRALVCGIFWISPTQIVINTKHLSILIGKCKSSINNVFQDIKYLTTPFSPLVAEYVMKLFPFMKNNCAETRQWTPRSFYGLDEPEQNSEPNELYCDTKIGHVENSSSTQENKPITFDDPLDMTEVDLFGDSIDSELNDMVYQIEEGDCYYY